jgi:hypothetical protein
MSPKEPSAPKPLTEKRVREIVREELENNEERVGEIASEVYSAIDAAKARDARARARGSARG